MLVKLKLPLDGGHHCLARFSQKKRLGVTEHVDKWGTYGSRAREEAAGSGKGAVCVCAEEDSAALDVLVRQGHFEVVEVKIQASEDDANLGIDHGWVTGSDQYEVLRLEVAMIGGVCAANVRDAFSVEFLLDSGFPNY